MVLKLMLGILAAMTAIPASGQTLPHRDQVRLEEMSVSLQSLSRLVTPAVVQVATRGFISVQSDAGDVSNQSGTGSGVILDPDGYIVTNFHVVEGAQKVEVLLPDGDGADINPAPAEIVGMDSETDLAVLKISRKGLPFLKLADSSKLQQGELVLACGSPFGLQNTISMGVVSSTARQLQADTPMLYIQTDAPINPGNSGGPLVNTRGEVLGINTMIYSQSGGSQGVGFAIPSDIVKNVYRQIRAEGHVHHGYLGLELKSVNSTMVAALQLPTHRGILVEDVEPDGPAALAGLQPADIIVSLQGLPAADAAKMAAQIAQCPIGEMVSIDFLRGSQRQNIVMKVAERPDETLRFAHMVTRDSNLIRKLGILALDLSDQFKDLLPVLRVPVGVLVAAKVAGLPSPSEEFEAGDLIAAVNGKPVANVSGLRAMLAKMQSGDPVAVNIQRGTRLVLLAFELP